MRLTRGKLMKTANWNEWQQSEFTMLDQYEAQGLFGTPVKVDGNEAVFNLVWTYVVKELDKCKKARCTCDGSSRSGQVRVLDHTYMQTVLIKQAVGFSMRFWRWKIYSYMALMHICQSSSTKTRFLH